MDDLSVMASDGSGKTVTMHTLRLPRYGGGEDLNVYGVEAYMAESTVMVILHEVPHNRDGTSITNASELVATDVVRGFMEQGLRFDPRAVIWVEHYPDRNALGYGSNNPQLDRETWDQVQFDWIADQKIYVAPRHSPYGDRHSPPSFAGWKRIL